jgi:hypothetical protein
VRELERRAGAAAGGAGVREQPVPELARRLEDGQRAPVQAAGARVVGREAGQEAEPSRVPQLPRRDTRDLQEVDAEAPAPEADVVVRLRVDGEEESRSRA